MNLTIAIPTVISREDKFNLLYNFLLKQISDDKLENKVEVIFLKDNKEISIGEKRSQLIKSSGGKFLVMIDDDDWVLSNYVSTINSIIEAVPEADCISYYEHISGIGAKTKLSSISNCWNSWADGGVKNGKRFDYVRTPYFKVPILTEYCRIIGCKDMRYAEDKDFADRLKEKELIQNEIDLERIGYFYRYKEEPINTKFNIQ